MKRILSAGAAILAVAFAVAALLLIRPNDLVEFFAGIAVRSVGVMQAGIGLVALALVAASFALDRASPVWVRAFRAAAIVALVVATLGGIWRDYARYSRTTTRFIVDHDTLAGTLYRPRGATEGAAVVIVHGSGSVRRGMYHFLARRFAERGFIVLNMDKRGVGESTGEYLGDDLGARPVIQARAAETNMALHHLAATPGVDRTRIGLVTLSQGGWVMASLLDGNSPASFAINLSGAAVSSGEEGAWSEWTNEESDHFGMKPPPVSFDELDRRMRTVKPSAYDPRSSLATMTRPSLWLFGEWDSSLPARASIAVLDSLIEQGKPVTWRMFPEANHGLFVVRGPNGRRLARYAPGVWDTVFAWTDRQRITR